jgi:hypothetical protein
MDHVTTTSKKHRHVDLRIGAADRQKRRFRMHKKIRGARRALLSLGALRTGG